MIVRFTWFSRLMQTVDVAQLFSSLCHAALMSSDKGINAIRVVKHSLAVNGSPVENEGDGGNHNHREGQHDDDDVVREGIWRRNT